MAVADGEVHVVYIGEGSGPVDGALRYAHRSSDGVWTNVEVSPAAYDIWSLALAIEPGAGVHFSAYSFDERAVRHAFAPCAQ